MATLPTLLRRGELRAPNGDLALQKELDKYIPHEYVTTWLSNHEGQTGIQNRILAIQSGTASGKSITIPSQVYIELIKRRYTTGGGVICTQPRILTAVDTAKQIAQTTSTQYSQIFKIGETIGWNTQNFKTQPKHVGLVFATVGIVAMQLQLLSDEEIMSMYRYIIIDEVHDRSLGTDLTLVLLKNFLYRNSHNPKCPFVILMSATFDPYKFIKYFYTLPKSQESPVSVDIMTNNIIICNPARTHPRQILWADAPIKNLIDETLRIIENIIETASAPRTSWDVNIPESEAIPEKDDILVFVPGKAEITQLRGKLSDLAKQRVAQQKTTFAIVVLNRESISENRIEYRDLDKPIRQIVSADANCERRIIISTSVAETGKTFRSLRYVIDFGYDRTNEYNPTIKTEILMSKPAQVARIEQRWGRVARKFPGIVYPLYPSFIYFKLPITQMPDILTSNLTPVILQIIFEQQRTKFIAQDPSPYFRIADMDMLDNPLPDAILDALERAHVLGFISTKPTVFNPDLREFLQMQKYATDCKAIGITKMGRVALELAMQFGSLEAARLVLSGFAWGYRPSELIMIIAFSYLTPENTAKKDRIHMDQVYQELFAGTKSCANLPSVMNAMRAILADTFVDGIIMGTLADKMFAQGEHAQIYEWAFRANVQFNSLLNFMNFRDAACSALVRMGFDIHKGVSIVDAFLQDGTDDAISDAILAYKRCVYDAYKLNLVQWDEKGKYYATYTGLRVMDGFIEKTFSIDPHAERPRNVIFDKFTGNERDSIFQISATQMSILDGFIGIDELFMQ